MKNKVTILLPVFNERESIKKTVTSISRIQKRLKHHPLIIIIADSSSTDGTTEIAKKLEKQHKNVHYINVGPGLGTGLYEGHMYALKRFKPDIMIQMDADGQVSEKTIPLLIDQMEKGFDLVLGSRFVSGGRNKLSFVRKCFTLGSSLYCRIVMGPFNVQEFTNSARAFTPRLFKRINWKRLPWRKNTFIIMPAFLNEAVLAGANYKEVPLVFESRDSGYSKNKVVNYTLDLIVYSIEARLRKWGISTALFNTLRG